jgi:PhzF family phenazine biosynthesis protein
MGPLPVRLYASFAARQGGGNIAGVVYDDQGLDERSMQSLATDLNASTTGFVRQLGESVFGVRFFSPTMEMDMCGHVTVGVFSALYDDGQLPGAGPRKAITATQRTAAGDLDISVAPDLTGRPLVIMRQNAPVYHDARVSAEEIADLLGLGRGLVVQSLGLASTALQHLFVQLPTVENLGSVRPNDSGLTALSQRLGVDTIGVWALHSGEKSAIVRVRDFCHGVGNTEEAASGTTNGALACWLARKGLLPDGSASAASIVAEQGFEMGRPSVVQSRLTFDGGMIRTVDVGGTATPMLKGKLYV